MTDTIEFAQIPGWLEYLQRTGQDEAVTNGGTCASCWTGTTAIINQDPPEYRQCQCQRDPMTTYTCAECRHPVWACEIQEAHRSL